MSYEVQAISPVVTPTDSSVASSPVMREERVVEPYRQRNFVAQTQAQTGQQNTIEQSKPLAEETPEAPEESVRLSPKLAALARKEQALRRQQQEFKAQQGALEADRAELARLKAMEAKIAAKDFSDIEKYVPYGDYSNYLIEKSGTLTPEQQTLKKLESELESVKKAQETDVERRFDAAVAERRSAVTQLVESKPEFKRIKKAKAEEAVVQHILDTWEQDDIELTPEMAAKEVDMILAEKAKEWASLVEDEEPAPVVQAPKELPPLKQGIKTLTNEMTIQGEVKSQRKSFQGMSDTERYAEARRRAEERLKQGTR